MAYKINGTTVVDNSRNVCACCVTSCCITASSRMDAPSGTTAQRPSSPATGSIYFDTDLGSLISYDGTAWSAVGGGAEAQCTLDNAGGAWGFTSYHIPTVCCRCFKSCCYPNYDQSVAGDVTKCMYPGHDRFVGLVGNQCRWTKSGVRCCGQICITMYPAECVNGCAPTMNFLPESNKMYSCCSQGGGYATNFFCCNGQFQYRVFPDGNLELIHYHCCTNVGRDWSGKYCNTENIHNLAEAFFTKDGKASIKQNSTLYYCPQSLLCYSIDYGALLVPTYFTSSAYGAVPWIGVCTCYCNFPRVSADLKCITVFMATSDSFGTNEVEVCCWARIGKHTGYTARFNQYTCNFAETMPIEAQCEPAWFECGAGMPAWQTQMGFQCGLGCLGYTLSARSPHDFLKTNGYLFSNRTDMIGGGDINYREMFGETLCTCTGGITYKLANPLACGTPYYLMFSIPGDTCAQRCTCNCIVNTPLILSPDGCCFISSRIMTTTCYCPICCCKVECCSNPPICWKSKCQVITTIIDRINGCVKCMFALCCIDLTGWRACAGYVKSCSNCIPDFWHDCFRTTYNLCSGITSSCYACYYNRLSNPCGVGGIGYEGSVAEKNYASAWSKFNTDCTKIYAINRQYCQPDCISIFDITNAKPSCILFIGCAIYNGLKAVAALGFPEQYKVCACAWGAQSYMAGNSCCCNADCAWACMTAITGCNACSLLQKCLGYGLVPYNGCCRPCIRGLSYRCCYAQAYINRSNDHYVFITSIGCQGCCCCYCAGWIGAICWDIENHCVSKVNTLYPPSACIRQKVCCQLYENGESGTITPFYQLCMTKYGLGQCHCCCDSPPGLILQPYGNYYSYIQSGCTDYGGVYIFHKFRCSPIFNFSAYVTCPNSYMCYFDRCNTGCCICGHIDGCAFCACQTLAVDHVPYDTPLECVGWRSEPWFACILTQMMAPMGNPNIFGDATAGTAGFCHRLNQACCAYNFSAPCVKIQCSNGCCPVMQQMCQLTLCSTWAIKPLACLCVKPCVYISSTYCCIGPVNLCDLFTQGSSCAQITQCYPKRCDFGIYDNIQPCHLDCDNTSKRLVTRFMANRAKTSPLEFYSAGKFERMYMSRNAGEGNPERFLRVYHENIICCC